MTDSSSPPAAFPGAAKPGTGAPVRTRRPLSFQRCACGERCDIRMEGMWVCGHCRRWLAMMYDDIQDAERKLAEAKRRYDRLAETLMRQEITDMLADDNPITTDPEGE